MLQAIHDHVSGRLGEDEFQETAHDAVRLCVQAQLRAGVDLVTDGEQRRDSYASFVGGRLDNCQLIPITDLLPYVDDPAEFEQELRALDVPAGEVRHPAVFGRLGRSRPLAVHELQFARTLTDRPIKVALPGPYLLTRTMWLECVSDRAYASREALAEDVVRVLREELFHLLAAGAVLVQFDEPVLTEVVFGEPRGRRSFMCGALSAKRAPREELAFAASLLNQVVAGAPRNARRFTSAGAIGAATNPWPWPATTGRCCRCCASCRSAITSWNSVRRGRASWTCCGTCPRIGASASAR